MAAGQFKVLTAKDGATTLNIMAFSITTLSIMGLVTTISKNDTQHRHAA
jgi:hypothetical protein